MALLVSTPCRGVLLFTVDLGTHISTFGAASDGVRSGLSCMVPLSHQHFASANAQEALAFQEGGEAYLSSAPSLLSWKRVFHSFIPSNAQVAGGLLADSPGFNQPSLENVTLATLADCFPEVREKAERCGRQYQTIGQTDPKFVSRLPCLKQCSFVDSPLKGALQVCKGAAAVQTEVLEAGLQIKGPGQPVNAIHELVYPNRCICLKMPEALGCITVIERSCWLQLRLQELSALD